MRRAKPSCIQSVERELDPSNSALDRPSLEDCNKLNIDVPRRLPPFAEPLPKLTYVFTIDL